MFFCYWVAWALYIFWILASYQIYDLQVIRYMIIYYHLVECPFIFWIVSFGVQKLVLCSPTCLFLFVVFAFGVKFMKTVTKTNVKEFYIGLLLGVLLLSGIMFCNNNIIFKSWNHFLLIFVYWITDVYFYSLKIGYPVSPTPFIKETVLSTLNILGYFVKLLAIYTLSYFSFILHSQDCFSYLRSTVWLHTNFRIVFSISVKNVIRILIGFALNL